MRTKLLRGLSIEFKPTKERVDGATRVIEAARMRGVALVDIPAYPKSLVRCCASLGEIRQQGPVGVQGEIDFGGEGAVISQQHRRRLIIEPGAVSAADDVVLLRGYSYDQPLASSAAGSLRVTVDEDGLRFVASRLADTAIARETKTLMRSGLLNSVVAGLQRGDKPGDTEIVQDGSWRNEIIRANAMLCELNLLTARTAGGGVRSAGRGRRWLQYA